MSIKLSEEQVDEIVKKYEAGVGCVKLGRQFGVGHNTIYRILKDKGINIRNIEQRRKLSENQKDKIVEEYLHGLSVTKLGKEYGVHFSTIMEALNERNIKCRGNKIRALSENDIDNIVEEYENGLTTVELGRKYGVSHKTIAKALNDRKIEHRGTRYSSRKELVRKLL